MLSGQGAHSRVAVICLRLEGNIVYIVHALLSQISKERLFLLLRCQILFRRIKIFNIMVRTTD